jgi:hypothetical protein
MDVIVLGGYGRAGSLCVHELVETTRARVVIAGRNAQRAQRAALSFGERATATYLDAADTRTLGGQLDDCALLVVCSSGPPLAALEQALETRTPLICPVPFYLSARSRESIAERAWQADVPVVLCAGAAPGMIGVLAESLVRKFPDLDEIRVASTGPWSATRSARADVEALRDQWKPDLARSSRRVKSQWDFPAPIGRRFVRLSQSLDLVDFERTHVIERVTCLEVDDRMIARGADRLLQRTRRDEFAVVAEAFTRPDAPDPAARITLLASDAACLAASVVGALARAILAGRVPSGLLTPREALNPGALIDVVRKRGATITGDA